MSTKEMIEEMENNIAAVEAKIRPLLQIQKELSLQIESANQEQAYTNRRPDTIAAVHAYTKDKTIAEIPISSDVLLKYVLNEISKESECVNEAKLKLSKINAILKGNKK